MVVSDFLSYVHPFFGEIDSNFDLFFSDGLNKNNYRICLSTFTPLKFNTWNPTPTINPWKCGDSELGRKSFSVSILNVFWGCTYPFFFFGDDETSPWDVNSELSVMKQPVHIMKC